MKMFSTTMFGLALSISTLNPLSAVAGPIPREASDVLAELRNTIPEAFNDPNLQQVMNFASSRSIPVIPDPLLTGNSMAFTDHAFQARLEGSTAEELFSGWDRHLANGNISPTIHVSEDLLSGLSSRHDAPYALNTMYHELIHVGDLNAQRATVLGQKALTCPLNSPLSQATLDALLSQELAMQTFSEVRAFGLTGLYEGHPASEMAHQIRSALAQHPEIVTHSVESAKEIVKTFNSVYRPDLMEDTARVFGSSTVPERILNNAGAHLGALVEAHGVTNAIVGDRSGLGRLIENQFASALRKTGWRFARSVGNSIPAIGTGVFLGVGVRQAQAGIVNNDPREYLDGVCGVIGCVPVVGDAIELPYVVITGGWDVGKAAASGLDDAEERARQQKKVLFGTFFDDEISSLIDRTLDEEKAGKINVNPEVLSQLKAAQSQLANGNPLSNSRTNALFDAIVRAEQNVRNEYCNQLPVIPQNDDNISRGVGWD